MRVKVAGHQVEPFSFLLVVCTVWWLTTLAGVVLVMWISIEVLLCVFRFPAQLWPSKGQR